MEQMTLEQAKRIAQEGDYGLVPLTRELYADAITPTEVMRILKNISRHCYMLESAEDNKRWGRYTFLGYEPALEITCRNGSVQIKNALHTIRAEGGPGSASVSCCRKTQVRRWRGFLRLQAAWWDIFPTITLSTVNRALCWMPRIRKDSRMWI